MSTRDDFERKRRFIRRLGRISLLIWMPCLALASWFLIAESSARRAAGPAFAAAVFVLVWKCALYADAELGRLPWPPKSRDDQQLS